MLQRSRSEPPNAAPTLTPAAKACLARAVWLDVERVDRWTWKVTGGSEPHMVRAEAGVLRCDCVASGYRRETCKHRRAVMLHCGDVGTLRALRALIPLPSRTAVHPVDAERERIATFPFGATRP